MAVIALRDQPDGSEATWFETGRKLRQQRDRRDYERSQLMWAVGDWLLQGEDQVLRNRTRAHVRELAVELTGYSKHTLAMAASVSRKMEPSMRIEGLTWWHHLIVTKLPHEARMEWLTRAAEEGWTATRLREELKSGGEAADGSGKPPLAKRLVSSLINLSGNEVPDPLRALLRDWWRRELGEDPSDVRADEQG